MDDEDNMADERLIIKILINSLLQPFSEYSSVFYWVELKIDVYYYKESHHILRHMTPAVLQSGHILKTNQLKTQSEVSILH